MGKGGRCPETRAGRYARCETPKPSWGSSALRRTLESRVLRKAHARFGEGRMEKCSWSNSPAAYSTSTTAATRGTSSPISLGSSCPSACGTGLTGSNQGDLVLSDISDQTLIDPGSALFAKISTLKVGQKVVFSGTFTRSETDCIKETSLTLSGSINKPEFILRFSEVRPAP